MFASDDHILELKEWVWDRWRSIMPGGKFEPLVCLVQSLKPDAISDRVEVNFAEVYSVSFHRECSAVNLVE